MKAELERFGWCGILVTGMSLSLTFQMRGQVFTTLHSFEGSDGAMPGATLVVSSNVIYGTTSTGGASNNGVVFSMSTNGTGYRILHAFTGGADGGQSFALASASLLLSSNTLYGTASGGGSAGNGVLFSLGTDGTRFTVLHSFSVGSAGRTNPDGMYPAGPLLLWSNTLYGTTGQGGSGRDGDGTVFALNPDGSGFRTLHSFVEGVDGDWPIVPVIPFAGKLYGATAGDPPNTVFSVNTNGTGFKVLHDFPAYWNVAGLLFTNSAFFGVTDDSLGPSSGTDTVFRLDLDGNFTNLHTFVFPASFLTNYDGFSPAWGPLAFYSNTLYGVTTVGGIASFGTVYSLKTDGSGFKVLYSFTGGDDGGNPQATVTLSGNALYGTTRLRGKYGNGTIFRIDLVPIPLPAITNQPASQTNLAGTTATFSVAATGQPPLSYQWLKSTNLLPQQISSKLVLTNLSDKDAGTYSVIVSNGGGSVASVQAYLVVLDPAAISTQPVNRTNVAGSTATFSVAGTGTAPLTYQWFKGASAMPLRVSPTLTLTNVSDGDAAAYHVVVTNSLGKATSASATLVVLDPPRITRQPVNQTKLAGTTATFTVIASGTAPLNYQWLKGKTLLPQQKGPSLTLPKVSDADNASYSVVITNLAGSITSTPATLTIVDLALLSGLRVGDNAVLFWPTGLSGFTLQSTTNLASPSWATNSTPPVIVNGQYTVTNPVTATPRFYRLGR